MINPLKFIKNHRKIIAIVTSVFLLLSLIIWLWQRQPQAPSIESPQETVPSATQSAQPDQEKLTIKSPQDDQVISSSKIKLTGHAIPNAFLVAYSPSTQTITQAKADGTFSHELELSADLNLVTVTVLSPNLTEEKTQNLTLYNAKQPDEGINTVYIGSVKTIFDPLITISNENTQKNIRTTKNTEFDIPKSPKEETATSPIKNIRIGDFVIALGKESNQDTLLAKKVTIIRENKPQNPKKVAGGKILTAVRNNLLTIKTADNQIVQLILDKNSTIVKDNKTAKNTDITTDQNTIIVYHLQGDQNLTDLLYLLP